MYKLYYTILIGILGLAGCSSSKVGKENSATASGRSYSKIFVEVATVDIEVRNSLETAIVATLKSEGYSAIKSLDVIPFSLKELKLPTKEEIEAKVKENECDAILIVSLSRKGESVNYTPGISKKENNQFLASILGDVVQKGAARPEAADIPAVDVPGSFTKSSAGFIMQGNLFDASSQEVVLTNQSAVLDISVIDKVSKDHATGSAAELREGVEVVNC